ncbi:Hsp20/alpha crystallin family protein [Gracilibacillus oryzae]|uniref:Hsp20/alpha crystallin family protein n=1 Tax=Gracilibacillus oryzae TaxID=1672701 RepID=A0A7C8GSX7_9BACI|nr:Hsp20/alpha crystallin family protein [Gracilibacillus oryzae]KAB8129887.1 Hsp20/alpha crystallin family protein [Gracilibacillus oryzae]
MDPFQQMHDWKNNLDQFFGGNFWNDFEHIVKPPIPAINLYELDNEIIVYVNLPGVSDRKNVNIYLDDNVLELKGETFPVQQGGKLLKQEILQGDFSRRVELPCTVRKDKVSAVLKHGVMRIQLFKLSGNRKKLKQINYEIEE